MNKAKQWLRSDSVCTRMHPHCTQKIRLSSFKNPLVNTAYVSCYWVSFQVRLRFHMRECLECSWPLAKSLMAPERALPHRYVKLGSDPDAWNLKLLICRLFWRLLTHRAPFHSHCAPSSSQKLRPLEGTGSQCSSWGIPVKPAGSKPNVRPRTKKLHFLENFRHLYSFMCSANSHLAPTKCQALYSVPEQELATLFSWSLQFYGETMTAATQDQNRVKWTPGSKSCWADMPDEPRVTLTLFD